MANVFELQLPYALLILPLPWLVWRFSRARANDTQAVYVPFYASAARALGERHGESKPARLPKLLLLLIWMLVCLAASQPTWVGEPITMQSSGRDLLLAVDISGSMEEQDMVIDDRAVRRIDAVKAVLNEFIDLRVGDRLGLVLFGSQAYLQAPLSFDRETIKQLLNEAELGFAGKQTAIGDAIGLAVKRLQARPADERVMILLTDGANTAGEVQPLQAAQLAAELDVKIYTIGMGADSMVVPGIFGSSFGARTVNPSRDLDEPTLQSIAQQTGGRYFRARDVEELQRIYAEVDALEPTPDDGVTYRPQQAYFFWPLGIAWGLSLLLAVVLLWRKGR